MNSSPRFKAVVGTLAVLYLTCSSLPAEVRTFTSAVGTTLKGELVSVIGDTVTIKKEDGTLLTLKISAFSRVDQAWLQSHSAPAPAAAANATKTAPFVNSLGMKFVPVPGTNILMCIHETRRKDYAAYADSVRGLNREWEKEKVPGVKPDVMEQHPVVNVSWEDAKAWCAWLGKKEGVTYRLPTDREWSCAVGLGNIEKGDLSPGDYNMRTATRKEYPWGIGMPIPPGAGNYHDITRVKAVKPMPGDAVSHLEGYLDGYGYTDGYVTTAPVMSFTPNPLGLYDLGGNVWEACEDVYTDPDHVYRGDSFHFSTYDRRPNIRSAMRGHMPRTERRFDHGFRCVLEAASSDNLQPFSFPQP